MDRGEFFKQIQESFFDNLSCSFEDFKSMLSAVLPACGELVTEIIETDDEKTILFKSINVFNSEDLNIEPVVLREGSLDMYFIALKLVLDNNGTIKVVEHGLSFFTSKNKEIALFLASIIDKKILL